MKGMIEEMKFNHGLGKPWARCIAHEVKGTTEYAIGNALMAAGGVLHRVGNRLEGSPWYDDCAQAFAGGVEEGRRMEAEHVLRAVRLGFDAGAANKSA